MFADISQSHTDCEEDSDFMQVANNNKKLNKRNKKLKDKIIWLGKKQKRDHKEEEEKVGPVGQEMDDKEVQG